MSIIIIQNLFLFLYAWQRNLLVKESININALAVCGTAAAFACKLYKLVSCGNKNEELRNYLLRVNVKNREIVSYNSTFKFCRNYTVCTISSINLRHDKLSRVDYMLALCSYLRTYESCAIISRHNTSVVDF